jgi:hypothetical protein
MNGVKFRTVLNATLVAGTLDILSAFAFSAMKDVGPGQVLRYVASGPFGDGMREGGMGAALIGLAVHYALMSIMVTIFAFAVERFHALRRHWYVWGAAYGFAIYLVMYWLVVPMRFGTVPKTELWSVGNALFSHTICVGLPMAYVVTRRPSGRITPA